PRLDPRGRTGARLSSYESADRHTRAGSPPARSVVQCQGRFPSHPGAILPMSRLILPSLLLLLTACPLIAEDWPWRRGPRGDGTSLDARAPLAWSKTENVRWHVSVPGRGYSSPVIHGDRIFLTSCDEKTGDRLLLCLDRLSGKTQWSRTVLSAALEQKHG